MAIQPIKPGWIRIQVEACGICGTDQTAAQTAPQWEALGHEVAGIVSELGPEVTSLTVGQRVVLESASFCGQCDLCRDGRVDLCNTKAPNFWGQNAMGMSDQFLVPAVCAVPYEGLAPEHACAVEPCGVAYDLVKSAEIEMGDRVLVIGPGPIGLAAAALARHRGAARLVVLGTRDDGRLAVARKIGAETVVHDGDFGTLTSLHRQFDRVLNTAPANTIAPALAFLNYGGIQAFIGIGVGDDTVTFSGNDFHFRKLQLRSSFASPAIYYPAVLRLMAAGIIPVADLVTQVMPLSRAPEAFALLRERRETALKVVLKP